MSPQRDHHTAAILGAYSLAVCHLPRKAAGVAAHADHVAVDPPFLRALLVLSLGHLHALGNPVGRLVYRLLLHDPPPCAAAAAAAQPVLVSIAALPDVAQFDWTMCSVEQAALHTLASHLVHFKKIDCVSGLSHTLHKSRIISSCVTPLVFSLRLRCVNCQDSRLQVRDCRFLSLRLWVTRALQFETPPVSQRHEPPCLDSVGSPPNSTQLRTHGQPQSNHHTTHQHNASSQCSREQLRVPTWHWFFVALRPALAALQYASRKPPSTSLLCIFQLACSQASMSRGQLRAFRGQLGDASNNDGFQCLSKSCIKFTLMGVCNRSAQQHQRAFAKLTWSLQSHASRPIACVVRKALAVLPWFFAMSCLLPPV